MDSRLRTPTLIYDFCAEVKKPKHTEESLIKIFYPKEHELSEEIAKQIPKFTWPMRTHNEKEEHFTFVLTDLDSKYKFGFCRYPPKGDSCMLFVSDLPWYKVFYRVLDKVSDLLLDHQIEVVEPFLRGLYHHPLPNLGVDTILSVVPSEVDAGQVYSFPLPNPKKLAEIPTDDNLTQFYTNLHYNVIMHLFANMIFERRIIITSSSLSVLSAAVHGAVLLLYPLHWQHIFIPITPPHLLDYCAAPMPFLMGVHSSYMDTVRKMPTDDIVILDVDESTIESAHVEDLITLPADVVATLKHVLKKQSSAYGDTVTRSFMLAQVALIGGYRSALKFREGEKEVIFDENQFLKSRPNMEEFLGELLHFQHFQQFINSKIEKLKSRNVERDIFDNEVLAYEEELKGSEQVKAVFDKFVSSTVEGSKKFAELSGKLGVNIKKQYKQAKIVMKKKNYKHKTQNYQNRYYDHGGQYINPAMTPDKRTQSLPSTHRFATDLVSSQGTTTPPPNVGTGLAKAKRPPPVIPYQRHLEGKKRLAESLKQQSASDMSTGILFTITPPDTPNRISDQTSLDHGERISLGSITEERFPQTNVTEEETPQSSVTEESVPQSSVSEERIPQSTTSGKTTPQDSITEPELGDLIDISSEPGVTDENQQIRTLDSISSTSVSTASSSDTSPPSSCPPPIDHRHDWEKFDEDVGVGSSQRRPPPLPPPRSELEQLYSVVHKTPSVEHDVEESSSLDFTTRPAALQSSGNPFKATETNPFLVSKGDQRPKSPFEDFRSSIAEALISNSEQKQSNDPTSASAFATTGKELFETIEEQDQSGEMSVFESLDSQVSFSSTPVLVPTGSATSTAPQSETSLRPSQTFSGPLHNPASSASSTADSHTSQTRTGLNPVTYNMRQRTNSLNRQYNSILRPVPQEGTFSRDTIQSNTNPFYSGSVNAGHYPALIPLSQKPSGPRSPSYRQNFPIPGASRPTAGVASQQKKPPPRPQPYAGEYQLNQGTSQNSNNGLLRRQSSTFSQQQLPSIGTFDPFADMLTGESGYVLQNNNTS